jgi:hypothetical protein
MKISKQQRQALILSGLLAVLAFMLFRSFFSSSEPAGQPAALPNVPQDQALDLKDLYLKRNPRRTGPKKETSFLDVDPSIHLEKLEDFDPGSPLNARNMFSVEPVLERTMAARNSTPGSFGAGASGTPGAGNQAALASRPAPQPTVIINLKFFGTKTDLRHQNRQGFFADGDEVYLASEGDLVANRYRILRIGDNSAEIEELGSKTRRQITLQ